MNELSDFTKFSINLSLVNTLVSKTLDIQLGPHGISFSDFMVLYFLENTTGKMMRRIDLAEKAGLSASGITRLVSPMEKIGLVEKKANKRDARVSLVKITESGSRILNEASATINEVTKEIFSAITEKKVMDLLKITGKLGGNFSE